MLRIERAHAAIARQAAASVRSLVPVRYGVLQMTFSGGRDSAYVLYFVTTAAGTIMVRRASAVLIAIAAIAGATPAAAFDNLDKGKSAEQLFRTNCATCHKSVRGLATAKGSWTLSGFLEEHYTTSKTAADTLAAYLIAVGRKESAARSKRRKTRATRSKRSTSN